MAASAAVSPWAPLRHPMFRALYIAQFASNCGTFMQLVGAQWLMGDLGGTAVEVSLVQTATSLPVFLFVLPSGALGDILDRRRLLLASQAWMLAAAALLAALTFADAVTPTVLLLLTFAIGAGTALTVPSFQAIMPELVGRGEIPQGAALNGVNFNVARAAGPAVGGALIAAAGAEWVFLLNAVSFLGTMGVLAAWRREPPPRPFGSEHMWTAVGAGARFVRSAPALQRVLLRAALFMPFAGALWALLPVLARDELDLGSGGYGLLLGSVGGGAIAGAFLLPGLRARIGLELFVGGSAVLFALATALAGVVHSVAVVVAALFVGGLAWIGVLSSLNASAQTLLPDWARARGLAYYTLTFQGGQALGAVVWGVVAHEAGVEWALVASAAGVLLGVAIGQPRPARRARPRPAPGGRVVRAAPRPRPRRPAGTGARDGRVVRPRRGPAGVPRGDAAGRACAATHRGAAVEPLPRRRGSDAVHRGVRRGDLGGARAPAATCDGPRS